MLWMVQRVFFGELNNDENRNLKDLVPREWLLMLPLVILMFWIGLYPKPFLAKITPTVEHLISETLNVTPEAQGHVDGTADSGEPVLVVEDLDHDDATGAIAMRGE